MTQSRDDMVIRPRLNLGALKVRERAQEERQVADVVHRQGLMGRWLRRRAAGHLAQSGAVRAARGLRGAAMEAEGIAARGAAGGAARAAGRTPIGLIVAGIVVAVAVTARLASGRSFENMGAQINKMILGDLDEEALAGRDARRMLSGDPDIARIAGIQGGVNAQMVELYKGFKRQRLMKRLGDAKIDEDERMQVNGLFDMIILRLRNIIVEEWKTSGGDHALRELTDQLILRGLTRYR